MQRVLSLDQAKNTGYASFLWDQNTGYYELTDSGVVQLYKGKGGPHQLYPLGMIYKKLVRKYCPHLVLLEDIYMKNNVETFKNLAKLQGVLQFMTGAYDLPFLTISPVKARSEMEVGQSKSGPAEYVDTLFPSEVERDENEIDAIFQGVSYFLKGDCILSGSKS